MKTKLNVILCSLLLIGLMSCSTGRYASAQADDAYYSPGYNGQYGDRQFDQSNVNINVFVDALSPYGRWMYYPQYGQVWISNEPNFIPYYTNGNWIYTNYGWTWASNYSWGWGPFHYGRWGYDPFYGWMWVPGYQWAPAWVGWRTGGSYFGWAPLGPGINIGMGYGSHIPSNNWIFLPRQYMTSPNWHTYRVNNSMNTTIINKTTVINNTNVYNNSKYVVGPKVTEVEQATGTRIVPKKVVTEATPERGTVVTKDAVNIYRPDMPVNQADAIRKNKQQRVPNQTIQEQDVQTVPGRRRVPQRNVQPENRQVNPRPENVSPTQRQAVPEQRQVTPQQRQVSPQVAPQPQQRSVQPNRTIRPQANMTVENERSAIASRQPVQMFQRQQPVQQQPVQRSIAADNNRTFRTETRQAGPAQQVAVQPQQTRPTENVIIRKKEQ